MFNFIYKIIGKLIGNKLSLTEDIVESKNWYKSKTIWAAVVGGILGIVQAVGVAIGHPIVIPVYVYEILGALGLYGLRTSDTTIK